MNVDIKPIKNTTTNINNPFNTPFNASFLIAFCLYNEINFKSNEIIY